MSQDDRPSSFCNLTIVASTNGQTLTCLKTNTIGEERQTFEIRPRGKFIMPYTGLLTTYTKKIKSPLCGNKPLMSTSSGKIHTIKFIKIKCKSTKIRRMRLNRYNLSLNNKYDFSKLVYIYNDRCIQIQNYCIFQQRFQK